MKNQNKKNIGSEINLIATEGVKFFSQYLGTAALLFILMLVVGFGFKLGFGYYENKRAIKEKELKEKLKLGKQPSDNSTERLEEVIPGKTLELMRENWKRDGEEAAKEQLRKYKK